MIKMSRKVLYSFSALALLATVAIGNNSLRGEYPNPERLEEHAKKSQSENSEEMKIYAECMNLFNEPDYKKAFNCFNQLLDLEPKKAYYHKMRKAIIKNLGWFEA